MNESVKRWAIVSLTPISEYDYVNAVWLAEHVVVVSSRTDLRIVSERYAATDDALACGSLPAMEAALRLLGGGE